jgi:ferredoxin
LDESAMTEQAMQPLKDEAIQLNETAFQRLNWAKKEGESYSDVILRLISTKLDGLQRRGEKEVVTTDNRRIVINVDQDKCLGAESCSALAPLVFALDISHFKEGELLAMREVMDRTVDTAKR